MRIVRRHPNKTNLLALVEVLTDATPLLSREYMPQFERDYPLADSPTFLAKRSDFMWRWQLKELNKTIGQEALENMKRITKKDFAQMPKSGGSGCKGLKNNQEAACEHFSKTCSL